VVLQVRFAASDESGCKMAARRARAAVRR